MAWHERDYYGGGRGGGMFGGGGAMGGGFRGRSITFWLIAINVAVFFLRAAAPIVGDFGYFSVSTAFERLQLWRVLTYQFLHAGLGHIFFNMLFLFFFGPMVEQHLGSRRFLAMYQVGVVFGVLAYVALWMAGVLQGPAETPMVGASAGIFAMLVAAAVIAPNTQVLVMFIFPMPLRWVAIGSVFIAGYVVLTQGANAGGQAAHLGGALAGFLLIKNPRWLSWADGGSGYGRASRGGGASVANLMDKYKHAAEKRRRFREAEEEAEIDRILKKVKDQGLAGLSEKEKKKLQHATERKRR